MRAAIMRPPARSFTRAINRWYAKEHSAKEQQIDYDKALWQHREFVKILERLGIRVFLLEADEQFPDGCFTQDPILVANRDCLVLPMKERSRRDEHVALGELLTTLGFTLRNVELGTCDGGDVVLAEDLKHAWVGRSERTDESGYRAVQAFYDQHGYTVESVPVENCLHLGTVMSYLGNETLLVSGSMNHEAQAILSDGNGRESSGGVRTKRRTLLKVPAEESPAANVLVVDEVVVMAEGYPYTKQLLERLGFTVITTLLSEFEKADGSTTCLALIFDLQ